MSSFFKNIEPLLSLNEVLDSVGRSRAWLYEQIRSGNFPTADKKHGRKIFWRKSTIETYLTQTTPNLKP